MTDPVEATLLEKLRASLKQLKWTFVLGAGNHAFGYKSRHAQEAWLNTFGVSEYRKQPGWLLGRWGHWALSRTGFNFRKPIIFPHTTLSKPLDSLNLNLMDRTQAIYEDLLQQVIVSEHTRMGNCMDMAKNLAYRLWEKNHSEIHRIEIMTARSFDHAFVVINREQGVPLNQPEQWHAWILDPWRHAEPCFHTSQYQSEMQVTRRDLMTQAIGLLRKGHQVYSMTTLLSYGLQLGLHRLGLPVFNHAFGIGAQSVYDIQTKNMTFPGLQDDDRQAADYFTVSADTYAEFTNSLFAANNLGYLPRSVKKAQETVQANKMAHQAKYQACMAEIRRPHP